MTVLHLEHAWLDGRVVSGVNVGISDGRIATVAADPRPDGATVLPGLTLPGFANVHSHAFHRLLRARTHSDAGDFWTWRHRMYELAQRLDPDALAELATAVFAEMLTAGYTAVGEFHYLHHGPGGTPYGDPNAIGHALFEAADRAGIRLTLIDTLYLTADIGGAPPEAHQLRFSDGDVERWIERFERLRATYPGQVAMGVHSVRAVPEAALERAAAYRRDSGLDLHVHVAEQPAEVRACRQAHGCTPVELLDRCGVLSDRTIAVHATHLSDHDRALLAASGTIVCMCPTTERELGDGIGPSWALEGAGVPLTLGSDSQAAIDALEEARALELNARLALLRRGVHAPARLLDALTSSAARALGLDAGHLRPGASADLVTLDVGPLEADGLHPGQFGDGLVFALSRHDVRQVFVAGRQVVRDGRHTTVASPDALRADVVRRLGLGGQR